MLVLTEAGLYCPDGEFHIDPMRPVERALITHGHADHARAGHRQVLATEETLAIMAVRYGADFSETQQVAAYGTVLQIGDLSISFHPAGHVLGSAQILLEQSDQRLVISGDYKREPDPTCPPFDVVPCDVFITEATFGLPVFHHPPAELEIKKLLASMTLFPDRVHMLGAYTLGKAQRLVMLLREVGFDRTIYLHGACEALFSLYQSFGLDLGPLAPVSGHDPKKLGGELVLCPPGALNDVWSRKFGDAIKACASGWMRVRARARQNGAELPLIVSDHADWPDLCRTILDTGASDIWVTHGQEDALVHWCHSQGLSAKPLRLIGYGDEETPA